MTPRIGSLCSGYGGLELGLMAVISGSVAWHVEYDKHPSAVLEARFPGVPNYGDITTTDWTQVEPVDWLTAGYPCQPFSHAGKRKGSADERHLWPAVADAIGVLRPGRVLLENVAGHISLGFDAVLADLAALGYDSRWGVVRAADAGAPHNRARIFIVARDAQSDNKRDVSVTDGGGRRRAQESLGGAGSPPADADRAGTGRHVRSVSRETTSIRRAGADVPAVGHGSDGPAPDASSGPLAGAAAARVGLPVTAERGVEPVADSESLRRGTRPGSSESTARHLEPGAVDGSGVRWGVYGPAIRRWELVTGQAAPRPTEPGRTGERLSPRFVEWMMGLPHGHVTDVLPRNPALKALGNGVVPQQAALAVRTLLSVAAVAA